MFVCVICRFDVELDDAIAATVGGRYVCLRCFSRETESARPMPKDLRLEVSSTLAGVGVVWAA